MVQVLDQASEREVQEPQVPAGVQGQSPCAGRQPQSSDTEAPSPTPALKLSRKARPRFDEESGMSTERKDVGLALEAAGEAEVPVARLLAERMDAIIRADGGERDWAALGQAPKGG
jgi:hypothetical protein